jgi:hypothetical protein
MQGDPIICITEGIPVQDMMRIRNYIDQKMSGLSARIVLVYSRRVKRVGSSPVILLFLAISAWYRAQAPSL